MKYSALIMAAGIGSRAGLTYNKVLHKINDKMILDYSIDFFSMHHKCHEVIVICNHQDQDFLSNYYKARDIVFIVGGKTRQQSVMNGLNKASEAFVLIHDAARPFINKAVVNRLVTMVEKHPACSVAVPSKNTLVQVKDSQYVQTIHREDIWQVQTPQAFDKRLIQSVHEKALQDGFVASDDTTLVAHFTDIIPRYILGDERSIKLTTPYDIKLLEVIL